MDSNFSLSYIGSLKTNLMFVFNLRDLWQAKCGNLTKREKLRLLIDSSAKYILRNVFSRISSYFIIHLVQIKEKQGVGKSLIFKLV